MVFMSALEKASACHNERQLAGIYISRNPTVSEIPFIKGATGILPRIIK